MVMSSKALLWYWILLLSDDITSITISHGIFHWHVDNDIVVSMFACLMSIITESAANMVAGVPKSAIFFIEDEYT